MAASSGLVAGTEATSDDDGRWMATSFSSTLSMDVPRGPYHMLFHTILCRCLAIHSCLAMVHLHQSTCTCQPARSTVSQACCPLAGPLTATSPAGEEGGRRRSPMASPPRLPINDLTQHMAATAAAAIARGRTRPQLQPPPADATEHPRKKTRACGGFKPPQLTGPARGKAKGSTAGARGRGKQ